ncbi:MAG: A/G-specific adenine glycosylase [Bacteroidia bacterium]
MSFSAILINWYIKNKRNLPWRNTSDPYKIWLSEIILQQTRVEQGLPYYLKFIEKYPDVKKLAKADEDEILKLWQGLGYYSRARNLHFTAKEIAIKHKGNFPSNYCEIRALKGIGDYTAAAIASFAYNLPHAVVDGNVMRVLSRYLGINEAIDSSKGKKMLAEAAQELLDVNNPAIYNQAIMEFGATFCVPAKPDCEKCPFNDSCEAFRLNKVNDLPFKAKKTKITQRYFHYFILDYKGKTYLNKRKAGDIWQGLYEFPMHEAKSHLEFDTLLNMQLLFINEVKDLNIRLIKTSSTKKHILSHQHIFAQFFHIHLNKPLKNKLFSEIPFEKLNNYALPRLIHRYLEEEKLL